MSIETVLNILNVKNRLFKIIQGKKLKYFGHIIRHDDTLQKNCVKVSNVTFSDKTRRKSHDAFLRNTLET